MLIENEWDYLKKDSQDFNFSSFFGFLWIFRKSGRKKESNTKNISSCFIEEIVFCLQYFSDVLWEKNVLII